MNYSDSAMQVHERRHFPGINWLQFGANQQYGAEMSFLAEIKRRKMVQVAVIYAVVAWVLVQIVATIEAPLNLPDWVDTLVIVLLAVGFPITLIFSWAFNITREGVVRDTGSDEPTVEAAADEKTESRIQLLPNSIAVLPFENLSPNPDDAYFSAGVHEQLLNELAKIRDINVIARTSVLQYAKEPLPIPQIAQALNVGTVMEGSVRYAGEKVRITAQLIDGNSGAHLWTEAYDGDLSDIFAIQTDIAVAIARALEAELLPETRARLERTPTTSPSAYALYLEASRYAFSPRWQEALALLDRAIELDPHFADAYARKGYTQSWRLVNAFVEAPSELDELYRIQRNAIENADRALEIDSQLGAAWLVRASVNHLTWRWKSAEQDVVKAYELSPNDPFVMREYALFKAQKGEHEDAVRMASKVAALNPNDIASYSFLSMVASIRKDFEQSLRAAEQMYKLGAGYPLPVSMLGHAKVGLGDFETAFKHYRTAEELLTDQGGIYMPALVYGYGLIKQSDAASNLYKRFETWAETHTVGNGGWIYAYLGIRDADKAYERLVRTVECVERGEPDAGFMAFLIILNNVHDDPILEEPRFKRLFEKIDTTARSR
jgi:TolB-like protein